jgi:hypothetical protein
MTRVSALFICLTLGVSAYSQTAKPAKYKIFMDVAHGEKFWHDPASMEGMNPDFIDRVKYMTNEFEKTAKSVDANFSYLKTEIKAEQLAKCDLLFIHIPSAKYSPGEVDAITKYLNTGGSLFLVLDEDYWSTLEQTNVNDLIRPFGIQFGGQSPDTLAGGLTRVNPITPKPLKVTYSGARIVNGGTPFCFNARSDKFPFGVFKELKNKGRVIVMGDGMVSLYMTEWKEVNDYQCQEFMHDAFEWLLKK